jgi:thiopurine S-methyltransferase
MEPQFWRERWEQNQIGFHRSEPNPHLESFWDKFKPAEASQVFVPFCGKSLDMIWLRSKGVRVLGVELSEIAVLAFFSENNLKPEIRADGPFNVHKADGIEIYCGDFFQLSARHLSSVAMVYDRASLVALPKAMRQSYAKHMIANLPKNAVTALLTFEYGNGRMEGPPFSVHEEEVASLYSGKYKIEKLHECEVSGADMEPFKKRGLETMFEKVYKLS